MTSSKKGPRKRDLGAELAAAWRQYEAQVRTAQRFSEEERLELAERGLLPRRRAREEED